MSSWTKYWKGISGDFLGFVDDSNRDLDMLREKVLSLYYSETCCSFVNDKGMFKSKSPKSKKVYFESKMGDKKISFNGIPFIIHGTLILKCAYGDLRKRKHKSEDDHSSYAAKEDSGSTKKQGCQARLVVKEILLFPSKKITESTTKRMKRLTASWVREALSGKHDGHPVRALIINLPRPEEHTEHDVSKIVRPRGPLDARVRQKIKELVSENVLSTEQILRHLRRYVKTLFPDETPPSYNNRRFYPPRRVIRNYVYRDVKEVFEGFMDFDVAEKKLSECLKEGDIALFRRSGEEGFLLIYQNAKQKHLLQRYGNHTCFLDTSYKMSRYAPSIFILCVVTNANPCVAALFAIADETSASICEALSIIRQFNPDWNPCSFIMDGCVAQRDAIKQLFPDCFPYLRKFHRLQSWIKWASSCKNGVSRHRQEIMLSLNKIANSPSEKNFIKHVAALRSSALYTCNKRFQNYVERQWLKEDLVSSWVTAFFPRAGVPATNIGTEALIRVLKKQYLNKLSPKTLSTVLTAIIQDFLPDQWERYVKGNDINCGSHISVPYSMVGRPVKLLKHFNEERLKSVHIEMDDINKLHDTNYSVNGYLVDVRKPLCTCFAFRSESLPCKHILAVMGYFYGGFDWNLFSKEYRDHPYFTIDDACLQEVTVPSSTDETVVPLVDTPPFRETPQDLHQIPQLYREIANEISTYTHLVDGEEDLQVLFDGLAEFQAFAEKLRKHFSDHFGGLSEFEPERKRRRF